MNTVHRGQVISVAGQSLTMSDDDGYDDTYDVTTNAVVTINGKAAKLSELKAGDDVIVVGSPATSVTAKR